MKPKIIITILFSIIINFSFAQCKQQHIYMCASQGCSIYLKGFNTVLLKDKKTLDNSKKFTFELNKGTHYRFNICSPDVNNKLFMNLYNSNDSLLISNFYSDGKYYEEFDFACKNTDNYYITINSDFKKNDKINAVVVLLFVGKNK